MDWFSGGIPEAVAYAQSKSAVFCVVILGEDSESENLKSSLESEPVQTLIRANGFVSIKISAGSQEHQQFSQIYTDARSPSIYCITIGGVPVEIISESLTPPQLQLALERAVQRHKETLGLLSKPPTQSTPIAPNTPRLEPTETEPTSPSPQHPISNSGPNDPQQMSLEERIERAKKLAAAKQAQKEAEDAAEARRREVERREAGKGLAEHKRRQDEEEAKKLVEERRKDKREEAELRRRVKEQFAQDRARLAKAKAGQTNSQPEQEHSSFLSSNTQTLSSSTANNSSQARLQFRLPDGSTHNHSFDPQSPLREVRQYVRDNLLKSGEFNLSVAFPRRQFSPSESENTLKELGLLPSSAILVIPVPSTSIVRMAGSSSEMLFGYFVAIIRVLCSPLVMVYSFFSAAVGGGGGNVPSTKQTGSATKHSSVGKGNTLGRTDRSSTSDPGVGSSPGGSQSTSPSNGADSGKKEEQKTFGKQEGNIRRLKPNDSDDENATWNGNSTQQM